MTDPDRGRLVILDPGDRRGAPGGRARQRRRDSSPCPWAWRPARMRRLYVLDSDNSRVQVFGGNLLNR